MKGKYSLPFLMIAAIILYLVSFGPVIMTEVWVSDYNETAYKMIGKVSDIAYMPCYFLAYKNESYFLYFKLCIGLVADRRTWTYDEYKVAVRRDYNWK